MILATVLTTGCKQSKKTSLPDQPGQTGQTVVEPASTVSALGYEVERFVTDGGKPVDITLIKHGTLAIDFEGVSIHIDPVIQLGKTTNYATDFPKADFILITHEHGDHLDAEAIEALTAEKTRLIVNEKSYEKLGEGETIANGEILPLTDDITLEAVPAYNTTPGREKFHPKGNGNGYLLTIDGLLIYIAGDTEVIPEMADLKDIDVAFLPVNQPYTMTVEQCVNAAKTINPKVLIPYHFGDTDLSELPSLLPGIDVRLRQMQ
ncbi:MAG: MBL fold metallo-hydrolase [Bacteroidales bacterium]|nr:MBL fold metallo-hydrolase [Bacteroidales bacterium]